MGAETQEPKPRADHVCPWWFVRSFDNWLRPLIHRPERLFGPWVRPGMTVLDVGCGRGFVSLGLGRMVGETGTVIAADLQPKMLEMVRRRAERSGLAERIRLHRCEESRIGLDTRVDFAVAFWMVHEVPDATAFLGEIAAALSDAGHLYLAEPRGHVSKRAFAHSVQIAQEAGLVVQERPRVRFSRAAVLRKGRAGADSLA